MTMTRALVVVLVILATVLGAGTALSTFRLDRDLDVGSVRLSVDPFHEGALDLYVPLVDWGVRFPVVRLPARVNVDVRSIDRSAVVTLAQAGELDVAHVRQQARDALAGYLRLAIGVAALAGLLLGVLVALAARGGKGPRLRVTIAVAATTSLAVGALLVVLLPPRSNVDSPRYYANGPEVPAALRTLESIGASASTLDEEIDEQLVGIARLVNAPADRALESKLPRLTVASDLHNNVIALPALERAARGGPLLFVGDLTDRGSRLERDLVLRILHAGTRLVFVSGNHDSDALERQLARAGAVVLTRDGRLNADLTTGPVVTRVGGLRIAGYDDPFKRLSADAYADGGATPTDADREAFAAWLSRLRGQVDVVMVHEPAVAQLAVDELRANPPARPLLVVWGHTHAVELKRTGTLTTLNPGSLGGGGTGNLAEGGGEIGLARLIYLSAPRFEPRAADLVQIDPGTGAAQAERHRLDEPLKVP
jgi:predicted phosphodiesterase